MNFRSLFIVIVRIFFNWEKKLNLKLNNGKIFFLKVGELCDWKGSWFLYLVEYYFGFECNYFYVVCEFWFWKDFLFFF